MAAVFHRISTSDALLCDFQKSGWGVSVLSLGFPKSPHRSRADGGFLGVGAWHGELLCALLGRTAEVLLRRDNLAAHLAVEVLGGVVVEGERRILAGLDVLVHDPLGHLRRRRHELDPAGRLDRGIPGWRTG